ncbi:MAG: beta-ketoacyl-ACP synthase III [Acutalibacteraceae bacterium]
MKGLKIVSTGSCHPQNAVSNDKLSQTVDTSDEWISTRTGIRQRYFCESEKNVDLASNAAKQALERSGISADEIGACVVATFTPDNATPSVACMVQKRLGLPNDALCFDMNAACSGFIYALNVARGILMQGGRKYALVIGSEVISRVLDFNDRSTCVLFGDGAGAAVVTLSENSVYEFTCGANGDDAILCCPTSGGLQMDGREVFKFAVGIIPVCIDKLLDKSQLTLEDIDYVVCHQANERIISHVVKKMKAPSEKFFVNLQKYGNTSAASIPLALDEMASGGMLKEGMKIICVGFGAGLTWGGIMLEW